MKDREKNDNLSASIHHCPISLNWETLGRIVALSTPAIGIVQFSLPTSLTMLIIEKDVYMKVFCLHFDVLWVMIIET